MVDVGVRSQQPDVLDWRLADVAHHDLSGAGMCGDAVRKRAGPRPRAHDDDPAQVAARAVDGFEDMCDCQLLQT